MVTEIVDLDLGSNSSFKIATMEGDIRSRFIEFHLSYNGEVFNLQNKSVKCRYVNGETTEEANLIINDRVNGVCTLEIPYGITSTVQNGKCELVISQSGEILSTIPFSVEVAKSLVERATVESSNEFGALNNALWEIDSISSQLEHTVKFKVVGEGMAPPPINGDMSNTIQLYIDKDKEIKGYPITSPDRVIDEKGISIIEVIDSKIANINGQGRNPIYYPNVVYNSNFGRFNEYLKPDFWETTGMVTTTEHLIGEYSLKLEAGEYMQIKDKPIQAFKWENKSTSFIFRAIGNGTIKVQILADGVKQEIFSYINDIYTSKNEFTFNINSTNWFNSKYSVELHKCRKTVILKIECITGNVYIDAVQAVPIEQGFLKTEIPYIDGPMCSNDVMQFRTTDLVNAKIGDMWFRSDL